MDTVITAKASNVNERTMKCLCLCSSVTCNCTNRNFGAPHFPQTGEFCAYMLVDIYDVWLAAYRFARRSTRTSQRTPVLCFPGAQLKCVSRYWNLYLREIISRKNHSHSLNRKLFYIYNKKVHYSHCGMKFN